MQVEQLVDRARRGDAEAFAALVERHHLAVRRTVRARLADEQDAQDVVQETFVRAWRELPGLRDPERFAAWLRRIAQRQCHDARSRWRQAALPIDGLERAEPEVDGATAATVAAVRAAVGRLPRASGEATALFYLEGYSVAEVAARLHVPAGTVRRRLHDARAQLRTALAGVGRAGRAGGDMPALTFDLPAGALRDALGRVLVALPAENPSAHHRLDAVLLDLGHRRLTLAASDGYRLAQAALDADSAGARRLLLPGPAVLGLARVLDRAAETDPVRVVLPAADGELGFATPLATVSCRAVDGTFPDLDAVLPSGWRTRVEIDGADLRRAAAVMEAAASEDAQPASLEAEPNGLTLVLELSEGSRVRTLIPATVEGEMESLRLNARLLRSLLEASTAARLALAWSGDIAPLVIGEVGGSGRWGLMPLRAPAEARTAA